MKKVRFILSLIVLSLFLASAGTLRQSQVRAATIATASGSGSGDDSGGGKQGCAGVQICVPGFACICIDVLTAATLQAVMSHP